MSVSAQADIVNTLGGPAEREAGEHFEPSRNHQLTRMPLVSSATFLICAIAVLAPVVLVSRSSVASLSSPTAASARSIYARAWGSHAMEILKTSSRVITPAKMTCL